MLASVIAAYVESLGERELDVPFRALLRAEGFFDIAFVHGVSEFGRDFIAKRLDNDEVVRQYHFQNKAGNINQATFREVRAQLEDIRTVPLRHPLADSGLENVIVLVTTGSLRGDAREAADGYRQTLPSRWNFNVWAGEKLIEMFTTHLHAALSERARGPLLTLLGSIDQGVIDQQEVERHSRRWIPDTQAAVSSADVMEAAFIANRLRSADRLDLACYCALGVLRAQLAASSEEEPLSEASIAEIRAAGEFFVYYGEALWARCDEALRYPAPMVNVHREFGFWATYPVRCMRTAELIALLALWRRRRQEEVQALEDWVGEFLRLQPGSAHPISDRYAVSLLAPAILLAGQPEILTRWLREVVRWTADRYEGESLGIAGVDATPEQEVEYLLGDLEHVELPERHESLVAGAVLDLASLLELAEIYDDARHEFYAVALVPDLRHPPEGRDAWLRDGDGTRQQLNAPFSDRFSETPGWHTAPHHGEAPPDWPMTTGLQWETLAVWTLLRDRWSAPLLRELVSPIVRT
jgi:hypothetical protein